ncbi:MAG: M3 family metallopeptidase [Bacteroidia bacterium]
MTKTARILLTLFITGMFMSCKENKSGTIGEDNPLLATWDTPYGVPPFDLIKPEHYKPALIEAMRIHDAEISAVANSHEKPDFKNTILALEESGQLLNRIYTVFNNLNSAETNEKLQLIAQEIAPEITKHNDNIYLNDKLFGRVKSLWDNQIGLNLNAEDAKLLERKYKAFVRNGAGLPADKKERLRKINGELSVISLKFGDNVLADTNSFTLYISDKEQLKGLPESIVTAAAEDAKANGKEGQWLFTLQNASVMPFLQYAQNRKLREDIWKAYQNRGNNGDTHDNRINIIQMANLRMERAQLLGYKSHADYVLEERMAQTPDKVYNLLNEIWKPALAKAKQEEVDIQRLMKLDSVEGAVQPYDWRYYTEKIRQQRYSLDEQELKPYFSLDGVREGIFMVCDKLYGIHFKQVKDVPVYHKDVTTWEVADKDGKQLGILYMDFFPREGKKGGAWMTSYRKQKTVDSKRIAPIISIVCNFTKPTANTPSLLTFDEASTFFHEFGHALHGLLSNVKYESLSGTSVPTDFVELPSQIMENWAAEPEVLKLYAKHYKTGKTIPDALIEKMQNAGTFDQGFATVEYLAAAYLDMDYHARTEPVTQNVVPFEQEAMKRIGLINSIIPRYRSTYYNHIFAGGYSAGYYSYIWSGVLDTDAFEAFKETSLFNKEKATSFRKNILERGFTGDPATMYRTFRGADPSIIPLLKKRGLYEEKPATVPAK